jgi:uncharacterized delta-60 repeat protein
MWFFSKRRLGSTCRRLCPSCHPRLELLEDRYLLSAGAVDTTFGNGGVVTTAIDSGAAANAVAVYPNAGTPNDSKIVAAGSTVINENSVFALARYNTNGSLDTSFGNGGTVTTRISKSSTSAARAVAIQSDGKILAAGSSATTKVPAHAFTVERYTTSGSLDPSFSSGGIVTTHFTGTGSTASYDDANTIALQSDGKIALAGTSIDASGSTDIALARYNANGSLDTSFGSGGKVITSYTTIPGSLGNTGVSSVALEPNGTIVVVGTTEFVGGSNPLYHPFVVRYTASGRLDTTFGGTGIVVLTQVPSDGAVGAVQGSDGKIVVAASDETNAQADLARLNLDGSLDTTFGTNGIAYESQPGAASIALQSDGKIVTGVGSNFVVRYLSNGAPDTSFGTNGVSATAPAPWTNVNPSYNTLAIQPDGGIVQAGMANVSGGGFALVRFLGTTSTPSAPIAPSNGSAVTSVAPASATVWSPNLVATPAALTMTTPGYNPGTPDLASAGERGLPSGSVQTADAVFADTSLLPDALGGEPAGGWFSWASGRRRR